MTRCECCRKRKADVRERQDADVDLCDDCYRDLAAVDQVRQLRFQVDPARDAALTRSFHRMLSTVQEPPRPPDGVAPVLVGYVQVDTRLLQFRKRQPS